MKTDTICQDTPCDRGVAERPRYYARQLITADDLTLEQEYFRNKLRAHNRLLHGWGVVCGGKVCRSPDKNGGYEPWKVVVGPGYILGPYGDEILIDRERVFDLRTAGIIGRPDDPGMETVDPWCSQVYRTDSLTGDLYIAVKYKECQARPVHVQPTGCSCDDNSCEYSRFLDGYEISVIDHCPEVEPPAPTMTYPAYLQEIGLMEGPNGLLGPCVGCPTEPWVVLAKITVDDAGQITEIDPCECRRIVISFGTYALRCHTDKPDLTSAVPSTAKAGESKQLILKGTNFKTGMKLYLGKGITVDNAHATLTPITGTPDTFTVEIIIDQNAQTGSRPMVLINPDCTTATFADRFNVDAVEAQLMAFVESSKSEKPRAAARPRKKATSRKGKGK